MKIFICGGTGLLGSHITVQLVQKGHNVTLYARNPDAVPALTALKGVTAIKGDFADESSLAKALPGHDVCITTVLNYGNGARAMVDMDVRPNIALGEIAADCGIKHFLFTSSTAALGDFRHDMDEDMISQPIDFYCAGQRTIELFLLALSHTTKMRVNIVRPGYFFGLPAVDGGRVHGGTVADKIAQQALAGEPVTIMERMGTQYLDAADLARIFVAVMESDRNREIYFGLGKPWINNRRIAEAAIAKAGSKSEIVMVPNPDPGRPKEFTLLKIKEHFGFEFDSWPMIDAYLDWVLKKSTS